MASDRRHRSRRATCSSTERTRAPRRSTTRTRRSRGVRHRPPGPDLEAGLGLRKFRDSLQTPPLIRAWRGQRPVRVRAEVTEVQLHADLPAVPGWGYNGSVPGPTIEVRRGRPTLIDWENGLGTITAPETLPFDVVRVPLLSSGAPDFLRANSPGGCSTSRGCGADAYPPLPGCDEWVGATIVHLHGALTNGRRPLLAASCWGQRRAPRRRVLAIVDRLGANSGLASRVADGSPRAWRIGSDGRGVPTRLWSAPSRNASCLDPA